MKSKYALNDKVRLLNYGNRIATIFDIVVEPWYKQPIYKVSFSDDMADWMWEWETGVQKLSDIESLIAAVDEYEYGTYKR